MLRVREFRAMYCLAFALGILLNLAKFQEQLTHFQSLLGERPLPLLPALSWLRGAAPWLINFHWQLGLSLIAFLVLASFTDRFARPALAFCLALLFLYGGIHLSADSHYLRFHTPARIFDLPFAILLLLLIEPGRRSDHSDTRSKGLVLLGVKLSLAIMYFGSGIAKLLQGRSWLGGETLQAYLLWAHFQQGSPWTLWIAQSLPLCAALAIGALFFELFSPALLMFGKGERLFLLLAFLFHIFAESILGVTFFFPFFAPAFLAFVPERTYLWLENRGKKFLSFACLILASAPLSASADATAYHAPHFACITMDAKLLVRPTPNCEGEAKNPDGSSLRYQQNSMGLWDRELSEKPSRGENRVLFLGNSLWIPHREGGDIPEFFRQELSDLPIETVNGSVNGYSLVQKYLFLEELLERYRPDLVLILGNVMGNGLSTWYHHRIARERDANDLVMSIGSQPPFWPLPESLAPRIWSFSNAFQWLIFSAAARELFLLSKRAIFGGETVAEVYERYLEAVARRVRKKGANLVVVREDGLDPGTTLVKYKAETITARLWPRALVSPAEADSIYAQLASRGIEVIDLRKITKELRTLPASAYDIPGDIHLTLEGMRLHGKALGKALRSKFAPKPKSK